MIHGLIQALETLTGSLQKVDDNMKVIEQNMKISGQSADPYIHTLETKIQSHIENLMARMVLVENRISLVETKVKQQLEKRALIIVPDGISIYFFSFLHENMLWVHIGSTSVRCF